MSDEMSESGLSGLSESDSDEEEEVQLLDRNTEFFKNYERLNSWSRIDDQKKCYIKTNGKTLTTLTLDAALDFLSSKFESVKHISEDEIQKAKSKKRPSVHDLLIKSLLTEESDSLQESTVLRHLLVFKKKDEAWAKKYYGLLRNDLEPWELNNKDSELSVNTTHILFDSAEKLTGNVSMKSLDVFMQLFKALVHNQVL